MAGAGAAKVTAVSSCTMSASVLIAFSSTMLGGGGEEGFVLEEEGEAGGSCVATDTAVVTPLRIRLRLQQFDDVRLALCVADAARLAVDGERRGCIGEAFRFDPNNSSIINGGVTSFDRLWVSECLFPTRRPARCECRGSVEHDDVALAWPVADVGHRALAEALVERLETSRAEGG